MPWLLRGVCQKVQCQFTDFTETLKCEGWLHLNGACQEIRVAAQEQAGKGKKQACPLTSTSVHELSKSLLQVQTFHRRFCACNLVTNKAT